MRRCLVRYGVIPEVARCRWADGTPLPRGAEVVVETHRGRQLGTIVQVLPERPAAAPPASPQEQVHEAAPFTVLRLATPADCQRHTELHAEAQTQFLTWVERIRRWNVDVQLVDLEWTLDRSKLILYVLNERGPECTKLAIQAAAAGLGVIEVQPVSSAGLVSQPAAGGGCGTCGCHS
jgi:cell fate regulator YaaT (PSP1 superfamily)